MTYDTFFFRCRSDDFDANHARVLKKPNRYLFEKRYIQKSVIDTLLNSRFIINFSMNMKRFIVLK
jgi:hypothetical protein